MRVFVSSVIGGMEEFRESAATAATTLRHEVKKAEDFGATSDTPQQTCLAGVRASEVLILILGARYGVRQESGKSATHEEYLEARDRMPVIVFIQQGVERDQDQRAFIKEVQDWAHGHFTANFATPQELHDEVLRGLHDLEVAKAVGTADPDEILGRATDGLPDLGRTYGGSPSLHLVVAGGPRQQILRPSLIEDKAFIEKVMQLAMFGGNRVLDPSLGTDHDIVDGKLDISQKGAKIILDELGTIAVSADWDRSSSGYGGPSALIEEDVVDQIESMIHFVAALLDELDSAHRLSEVAVIAHQTSGGFLGWQTRAEAGDRSGGISMSGTSSPEPVELKPPTRARAALTHETRAIAEDLMVLLRRQIRG
jgi:hypothetical protein